MKDARNSKEKILEKIGLKKTKPRLKFIDFFQKTKRPSSAQDIFNTLEKKRVNTVTVYKTLESFINKRNYQKSRYRK